MEATRIAPPRRQVRAPGYIGQDGPLSIRLDLSLWGAQDFQSAQSGGVAALDSQFLENVSQVFFHGLFSHATNDGGQPGAVTSAPVEQAGGQMMFTKYIVVVDDDVNVHNTSEVVFRHAACDPLQKGLLSDLPQRHKVIRFRIS